MDFAGRDVDAHARQRVHAAIGLAHVSNVDQGAAHRATGANLAEGWETVQSRANARRRRWYVRVSRCNLPGSHLSRRKRLNRIVAIAIALSFVTTSCRQEQPRAASVEQVGPAAGGGGYVVSTKQFIRPAGKSVEFRGRPVDLVLSPDGKTVYVK